MVFYCVYNMLYVFSSFMSRYIICVYILNMMVRSMSNVINDYSIF